MATMFKKLVSQAIKERVGTSRVVDQIKDVYDYIIGEYMYLLLSIGGL